jgi:ubiquinone/menaquinone biosynthesis C-methylase UbiE
MSGMTAIYQDWYANCGEFARVQHEWRLLGAKYKANSISKLAERENLNPQKVLEVGAGSGEVIYQLSQCKNFANAKFHALEIEDSAVELIQNHNQGTVEARTFDGYTINYPDNFFDLVYATHVLEHVEHPRILIREMKRVAKYLFFEVPLDYSKKVDHKTDYFISYGHINIYTPALFRFLIKSEGLKILNESYGNMALASDVLAFNWYDNMQLKKSLKRQIIVFMSPLKYRIRNLLKGYEYGYSEYACICKTDENLTVANLFENQKHKFNQNHQI